jgi:hypothetical protein
MKKLVGSHRKFFIILTVFVTAIIISCNSNDSKPVVTDSSESKKMSESDMIKRGDYLVTTIGCNDCHSPKKFGPQGPYVDSSRLLSGHPADSQNPPLDKKALTPGSWYEFSPDLTTFTGPWGASYSINLTPDSATGIGNWTDAIFIKALRTGKHMGLDEGRPILPPMPWSWFGKMTDEDLKSIFTYLHSLPPISNRVPAPLTPPEFEKIAK